MYYEGDEGYCFHDSETKTDAGIRDIPMTQMVYAAFRKQRELNLMPPSSSHTLRHTGCTRLGENNVNPKVMQYVMGCWMSGGDPAPTVAERRTFRCTDHNECLQSYCREVSCGERDV